MRFAIVYLPSCVAALLLSVIVRSGFAVDMHREVLHDIWSTGLVVLYATIMSGYAFTLPVLLAMLDRFATYWAFVAASIALFSVHLLIGLRLAGTGLSPSDALPAALSASSVFLASTFVYRSDRS